MTRILAVLARKGGVGKTVTASNLAAALGTISRRMAGCADALSDGSANSNATMRARDLAALAKRITKHLARTGAR